MWSAGPAAVALTIQGPWVVGALANTQWSFAGWGDKFFTQSLIQPFVNYNFEKGLYLSSSPIITCNWEADSGNRWTVPIGGGIGKTFQIPGIKYFFNASLQGFYNVVHPNFGDKWTAIAQIQIIFEQ
jgi:hypothetical protein